LILKHFHLLILPTCSCMFSTFSISLLVIVILNFLIIPKSVSYLNLLLMLLLSCQSGFILPLSLVTHEFLGKGTEVGRPSGCGLMLIYLRAGLSLMFTVTFHLGFIFCCMRVSLRTLQCCALTPFQLQFTSDRLELC
jgi:hypothetical protein